MFALLCPLKYQVPDFRGHCLSLLVTLKITDFGHQKVTFFRS